MFTFICTNSERIFLIQLYTGFLAPADFSGAGFTCANIQLMQFLLHKRRNSFTHAFLVTNDLSAADLAPADFCKT